MSPEEKVLWYSSLSFLSFMIIVFGPICIKIVRNYSSKSVNENAIMAFFAFLSIISSVVFYTLAMTKINKIKKNSSYKKSIFFLVITSLLYACVLILIFSLPEIEAHYGHSAVQSWLR